MDEVRTPDAVLADIRKTRGELLRGSSAIYDAETAAELAELAARTAEDLAFLNSEGAVEHRKAQARLAAHGATEKAIIARAGLNRVKTKIRGLESALVSLQAELKWMKEEGA